MLAACYVKPPPPRGSPRSPPASEVPMPAGLKTPLLPFDANCAQQLDNREKGGRAKM
jgi:hypothetical protein